MKRIEAEKVVWRTIARSVNLQSPFFNLKFIVEDDSMTGKVERVKERTKRRERERERRDKEDKEQVGLVQ
jgi:hypothetical protein